MLYYRALFYSLYLLDLPSSILSSIEGICAIPPPVPHPPVVALPTALQSGTGPPMVGPQITVLETPQKPFCQEKLIILVHEVNVDALPNSKGLVKRDR
jgi:hypothetical protein